MSALNPRLLINSTPPPPTMPYLPLPYSNPPPPLLFAFALESSCARALWRGWGAGRGGRGLSWGWSSWIPHHGNRQTFTKHWGISSYQLDYWSPQRAALVRNKCWISSGPWQGLEPHCHLHLFPLHFFSFFDRVGKLFFMSLLPLAVPFFSCPCLSPALSLSVLFWKREPLCHSIFTSPLLCCAHCHPVENRVTAVGLVLRKQFSPAGNLNSYVATFLPGPDLSAGSGVCRLLGCKFCHWLMPKVVSLLGSESCTDSAWLGKARNPQGLK